MPDGMKKADGEKVPEKTATARDGKQSEKIRKPIKEEGEKKTDEESGSNQNSEPVAPAEATE